MIIGIDFGKTIREHKVSLDGGFIGGEFPDSIRVINKLVQKCPVYIVSKVTPEQEIDVRNWLDKNDFFNRTGILKQNVHFCPERKDKGLICNKLNITHFIDDRPEVMAYLEPWVCKFLFRPVPEDVVKWYNKLHHTTVIDSWLEIEEIFFQ